MTRAAQEFALLSFLRERLSYSPQEWANAAPSDIRPWHALAAQAAIAEAHRWLEWGVALRFFPDDSPRLIRADQQMMLRHAVSLIANEDAYRFNFPAGLQQHAVVADTPECAMTSLYPHFQQLMRLAAAFAKQRPAATMLVSIMLDRSPGRFSFYELPSVLGRLTGDDIGAVLSGPSLPESSRDQIKTAGETLKRAASALACRAFIARFPERISDTTPWEPTSGRSDCVSSCSSIR